MSEHVQTSAVVLIYPPEDPLTWSLDIQALSLLVHHDNNNNHGLMSDW